MGPCLVAVKLFDVVPDVRGADFSVVFGPCENLVPRSFDRPGLVDVDVSRLCGQHPFVAAEQPVDDRGVGLRAPDQEIYLGPGGIACAAYEFAGVFRVGVAAVSGGLFEVCFGEASQDLDAAREQVDQVINKTIQKSATFSELGRTIVEESKEALVDLDGRVATLLSQAQNTENVVEDVCGSIKKFDGAKINLTKLCQIIHLLRAGLAENIRKSIFLSDIFNILRLETQ